MRLGVSRGSYSRDDIDGDIQPEEKNIALSVFVDSDWLSDGECHLRHVTSRAYGSDSLILSHPDAV